MITSLHFNTDPLYYPHDLVYQHKHQLSYKHMEFWWCINSYNKPTKCQLCIKNSSSLHLEIKKNSVYFHVADKLSSYNYIKNKFRPIHYISVQY